MASAIKYAEGLSTEGRCFEIRLHCISLSRNGTIQRTLQMGNGGCDVIELFCGYMHDYVTWVFKVSEGIGFRRRKETNFRLRENGFNIGYLTSGDNKDIGL